MRYQVGDLLENINGTKMLIVEVEKLQEQRILPPRYKLYSLTDHVEYVVDQKILDNSLSWERVA